MDLVYYNYSCTATITEMVQNEHPLLLGDSIIWYKISYKL